MNVVKKLVATTYTGDFENRVGDIKVEGTFRASADKKLISVDGNVAEGDGPVLLSFNGYIEGEKLVYNFGSIRDLDKFSEAVTAVRATMASIGEDLDADV